jgi:hypothetical protein
MLQPAGNLWLKEHFKLKQYNLSHLSYIGSYDKIEVSASGEAIRIFGPKYAPKENTPLAHLEFALKYDDINLGILKDVFIKLPKKDLFSFIKLAPSGKYSRKIGYLYELLTEKELPLKNEITANYIDLLDTDRYIAGNSIKNAKWKINDNLLGNKEYCPIVRRTKALDELLSKDVKKQIQKLEKKYSPQVFKRAISFLYTKETRSSYEIEREMPSADRMERFISLLQRAGSESSFAMMSEKSLTEFQNIIVDPRFANKGFRNFQNYIGENMPNFLERIHYICPPPEYVNSLMNGLQDCINKTPSTNALVRTTLVSFGFVFIHPFEDGNGRLHRFLIHDMLVRNGIVENGLIIPVSAHMLNNMKEYDNALENYSKQILQHILYKKDQLGEITVTNSAEVEAYYRYPDLTSQCIYLAQTVSACIAEDMPNELNFIKMYDELKAEIRNIVDMPDKLVNQMIMFLHQNKGVFPKRRRKDFSKLRDEEIKEIEKLYVDLFE